MVCSPCTKYSQYCFNSKEYDEDGVLMDEVDDSPKVFVNFKATIIYYNVSPSRSCSHLENITRFVIISLWLPNLFIVEDIGYVSYFAKTKETVSE